jgi:hypothetical protein
LVPVETVLTPSSARAHGARSIIGEDILAILSKKKQDILAKKNNIYQ